MPVLISSLSAMCAENEWECGNGLCLDSDFRCNGVDDCFDSAAVSSDETDCGKLSKTLYFLLH